MRARIYFQKNAPLRFSSVLDLHKIWERTSKRANLKLVYSSGYHPQAKIQIANPLPTGFTGRNEVVDIWYQENMTTEELQQRLIQFLPDGITINSIEIIPVDEKNFSKSISKSHYLVTIFGQSVEKIDEGVREILSSSSIERMRNNRVYDLRPLIESIEINQIFDDRVELMMDLSAKPNMTGRPDEIILHLGISLSDCIFDRIGFS